MKTQFSDYFADLNLNAINLGIFPTNLHTSLILKEKRKNIKFGKTLRTCFMSIQIIKKDNTSVELVERC